MSSDTPAKVLVLDDDADLRARLQRYIGDNGLEVRVAPNRAQLGRLLRREPFDVLVLDLMLPGDNGLDICRDLRAQGEALPILSARSRNSTPRGHGGAGLAIAIAIAIAEGVARAHGGRLDLLPRDGGGLEARLVLQGVAAHPPSAVPPSGSLGEGISNN